MSEADKYQGYSWIKVQRSKPVDVNGTPHVSEAHHIEETTFLIEEIRKLAARIDRLNLMVERYDQRPSLCDDDYLAYEEDVR